ncbi:MAG TPA: heme-binding protein [Candidatus Methylomirabilis sp.]|nr:heme-binding protein [Candidatus Methylomirabilis sp.]
MLTVARGAVAEDKGGDLVPFRQLSLELANEIAWNALKACRRQDAQVAVAVVDRGGRTQVLLRDALAGPHTVQVSQGKALTALSFRIPTSQLAAETGPGSAAAGLRNAEGVTAIGGGLVIQSRGSIVGAIGVSGAPGPANDEACARAGIDSVLDRLALPD